MSLALIAFNQEPAARLLISHLKSHGIEAEYAFSSGPQGEEQHQVLLRHTQDIDAAKVLTEKFLQNPNASEYQQDAWEAGEQTSRPMSLGLSNFSFAEYKAAPFSLLITAICVTVFLAFMMGGASWVREWLFIQPIAQLFSENQWWRLFTPDFIHFSAMHLVFNLMWWLYLGAKIERHMGLSTLLIVFVVSSVVSNSGQLLVSGPNFGGMSGVVYALVGFFWWLGWLRPEWKISLPKTLVGFMLVWLLIGYADVLWISMANTAHTLGLVSGCLLALAFAKFSRQTKPTLH